jgi:hypothetical protein
MGNSFIEKSHGFYSKKIFFLYPVTVVFDLLKDLLKSGYEVYVIKDHTQIPKLVKLYQNCIIYINIFEKMEEKNWEKFIKNLILDPENSGIQVGICTYATSNDEELSKKYLMDIGITGGYINLHASYKKSIENVMKILEASEARGKRKYVRVKPFENDEHTFVLIETDEGKKIQGKILDISICCMSVEFTSYRLVKNQIIRDVMLKLRGVPCPLEVFVKGYHNDNKNIYLLMFVIQKPNVKEKIFDYIYERLQADVQNI